MFSPTVIRAENAPEPVPESTEPPGGFLHSFRKRVRSVAGVDSPFVNPYLGTGHSSTKLPPYGPTSWGDDQARMYDPYRLMSPMPPPVFYPPPYHPPYLYPSTGLMDYSYGMHGYPYTASALPVQDKRLLPERNYFSAVKDIWRTNLQ